MVVKSCRYLDLERLKNVQGHKMSAVTPWEVEEEGGQGERENRRWGREKKRIVGGARRKREL